MGSRTPRGIGLPALSSKSIASVLAPTVRHVEQIDQLANHPRYLLSRSEAGLDLPLQQQSYVGLRNNAADDQRNVDPSLIQHRYD